MDLTRDLFIFAVNFTSLIILTNQITEFMATKDERGNYKGLVGNTVSYTRNGKEHLRLRARGRKDKSKLVLDSRNDFKIIMKLIKMFKPLIDTGFKDHKKYRSAYHSALSANRLNYNYAMKTGGVEDLEWFKISDGNLSNAEDVSVRRLDGGLFEITWQGTERGLTAHNDDLVFCCISSKESGKMAEGPTDVTRDTGRLIITPSKSTPLTGNLEVFFSFKVSPRNYKPESDRNVSKSKWIGLPA